MVSLARANQVDQEAFTGGAGRSCRVVDAGRILDGKEDSGAEAEETTMVGVSNIILRSAKVPGWRALSCQNAYLDSLMHLALLGPRRLGNPLRITCEAGYGRR